LCLFHLMEENTLPIDTPFPVLNEEPTFLPPPEPTLPIILQNSENTENIEKEGNTQIVNREVLTPALEGGSNNDIYHNNSVEVYYFSDNEHRDLAIVMSTSPQPAEENGEVINGDTKPERGKISHSPSVEAEEEIIYPQRRRRKSKLTQSSTPYTPKSTRGGRGGRKRSNRSLLEEELKFDRILQQRIENLQMVKEAFAANLIGIDQYVLKQQEFLASFTF